MTIVQSLWVGNKLTRLEIASINSFIKTGHIFWLYTYEDVEGVPDECIIMDANLILDKEFLFEVKDSFLPFSDIWRYKLLSTVGGYWVDLDMIALKKFDFKEEYVISSERTMQAGAFKSKALYTPNIGVLKGPPDSVFFKEAFNKCIRHLKKYRDNADKLKYMKIFKKHIITWDFQKYVKTPEYFCNLDWWYTKEMYDIKPLKMKYNIEPRADLLQGYSIHMWRHMSTTKYNKDLDEAYDSNCLYEKILLSSNIDDKDTAE